MMKKKYTIKPPSKKVLKPFWTLLEIEEDIFYGKVMLLERKMAKKTGIKDIEFFKGDGEYVGIGNASRTMKLIHRR